MSLRVTFKNIPVARPLTIDLSEAETFMSGIFRAASTGAHVISDKTDFTRSGRDRSINIGNGNIDLLRSHLLRACTENSWNEIEESGQTVVTVDMAKVESIKLRHAA